MSQHQIQFDKTRLGCLIRERNTIVNISTHKKNEEESNRQSDSGSPSQMSSGESDPEAPKSKELKHIECKTEESVENKVQMSKSMWLSTSDKKQSMNSSFAESDQTTAASGKVLDHYSMISQNDVYSQQYYQNYPQFMEKKSFSSQALPKKKSQLNFNQNYSFNNEYQEPSYPPYTPFQQQQVRKRQFAPQMEVTRFQIYLDKVEQDGRTTLMIRNIPNKYTQPLILEDVDVLHKDKYDFFYLPIDFTNKCNVGYAFINFTEVKHIKDFFLQYHGQRWKMFNSEKICQITYARIQGGEELLNHFKFSSIINLKDKKMKPVFFHKISQIVQKQKQFYSEN